VGAWRNADAEDLKSSVRKDVQVRVLPPLPKLPAEISLGATQFRAYAYLLGIYLGDGHITHYPRTLRIDVYLNAKETRVIRQTVEAMRTVLPDRRIGFRYRPAVIVVNSYSRRHRRIVNGTNNPASSFTNRSEDILGLFTAACNVVGLRWTRANRETISIARRREVAYLDGLIARATEPYIASACPSSLTNTSTPGA
jgi:hypothetical protein